MALVLLQLEAGAVDQHQVEVRVVDPSSPSVRRPRRSQQGQARQCSQEKVPGWFWPPSSKARLAVGENDI